MVTVRDLLFLTLGAGCTGLLIGFPKLNDEGPLPAVRIQSPGIAGDIIHVPKHPVETHALSILSVVPESALPANDNQLAAAIITDLESADTINYSEPTELVEPQVQLENLGVDATVSSAVYETLARQRLEFLDLRDTAAREGWLDTPKYQTLMHLATDQSSKVRDEFGDYVYDRYLYASGLPNRIVVNEVYPGSQAEHMGLRPGDVLEKYDRQSLYSATDLTQATATQHRNQSILMEIRRGDEVEYISLVGGPIGIETHGIRMVP